MKHLIELPSAGEAKPTFIALKDIRAIYADKEEGCNVIIADSRNYVHTTLDVDDVTAAWEAYLL